MSKTGDLCKAYDGGLKAQELFKIKATFLDSGFFGGCGMASNRHAFAYLPGDLPLSIKWGCCTAELTDFDAATHTGNYVANGRVVAEIVRVGDAL